MKFRLFDDGYGVQLSVDPGPVLCLSVASLSQRVSCAVVVDLFGASATTALRRVDTTKEPLDTFVFMGALMDGGLSSLVAEMKKEIEKKTTPR